MKRKKGEIDGSLYFRLLAAVAAVDGKIRADERVKFKTLLVAAGVSEKMSEPLLEEALENRAQPLWFLENVGAVQPQIAGIYLRDALVVAYADGRSCKTEERLIKAAARKLGVESSFEPLRKWTKKWMAVHKEAKKLFLE